MAKKRVSIIWKLSKEEFKDIVDNSSNFGEIARKCGFDFEYLGGYAKTIKKRMVEDGLSFEELDERRKIHMSNMSKKIKRTTKIPIEDILVENSTYYTSSLRKRLILEGFLINKCDICGMGDTWLGNPITLQLDHINGIHNDHRIENLRILCPNCHSQTDNFTGRNHKKKEVIDDNVINCSDCDTVITKNAKKGLCSSCSLIDYNNKVKNIKDDLDYEEIFNKVSIYGFTAVSKELNITSNGLKKRLKVLGFDVDVKLKYLMEYNKYKNNASGLKNILLRKKGYKIYMVSFHINGKNENFGAYETREEAAKVADEKMIELFGEDVLTNKKLGLIDY